MKTKLILLTIVTAVMALGQPAVSAAPNKAILTERGYTEVVLDANLIPTLNSLGVSLAPLPTSTLFNASEGIAYFPITAGIFDPVSTTAEIAHSGGLVLSSSNTQLVVSSFLINVPSSGSPVLTGIATLNGALVGRIPLFDINLSGVSISYAMMKLTIANAMLTLNGDAAATLNAIFGTSAFTAGIPIGVGEVGSYYDKLPRM